MSTSLKTGALFHFRAAMASVNNGGVFESKIIVNLAASLGTLMN